ncbi:SDR family NAD(P)-dependent oxidoreductase [Arthrobacter sp. efr-133-TYG-118]|uniref:SDR family NAD(P)-dependent oxidoreductase n=1 Tax=Arthrobacter sp. efr-133-TYG-118 TaxID=3040279 RepID=UPI00254C3844|nr:SDR family NAD(P)-dependent oxidoreductase [Arthrobacter sp. efr-133-TYG-118]
MSKLALITGASSGIGWAFAERLAADGYDLVIVGRRQERLEEFAVSHPKTTVRTVVADLSTPEGIGSVAEICATEPVTLLVNNAGVAHYMPLAELPADKATELVNVKVLAPTMLSRAVVPGMQERGEGTIINVAGMIAFGGLPRTPRCPAAPSTAGVWRTSSRCPRLSARNWRAPESRFRSCARAWWPPSSTSAKAWT